MMLPIGKRNSFYLGQVRKRGRQTWETVTGRCLSPESALSKALMAMRPYDQRARAIWVDRDNCLLSHVVMETSR